MTADSKDGQKPRGPESIPDLDLKKFSRTRRKTLLFFAVVFLAVFAILETIARIFAPIPILSDHLSPDPHYGYVAADFEPRLAPPKDPQSTRILILGDSFAMGDGAETIEKRFADVALAELRRQGGRWDAVNAGVTGWGPSTERHFLEREGLDLKPDIVLTQVFLGNDASDETGITKAALFHGRVILASRIDTWLGRALSWGRIHCRLLYFVVGSVENAPLVWARNKAEPPYPGIEWRKMMSRRPLAGR